MNKDVIYIDTEDDITAIISKLKASAARVVALVPPKRSAVLSSVVNLKLLNKAAENNDKRVVLITQEKTLVALAGGIGMYVAENLKSPPVIPAVDKTNLELPSEIIEDVEGIPDVETTTTEAAAEVAEEISKEQPIAAQETAVAQLAKKPPKVPDFNRFKKKLLIAAGLLVVLGLVWWQAFYVLPEAVVTLEANTSRLETEVETTLDEEAEEVDTEDNVLPVTTETLEKDVTETFNATGEENQGEKASGTLTIENCSDSDAVSFVSGTAFVANSGHVFFSTESVTVPGAKFGGGECEEAGVATVQVTAEEPGTSYNIGSTSYIIRALTAAANENYTVTGSKMSGGTDKIIKIITTADVKKAVEKAKESAKSDAIEDIKEQFEDDIIPIEVTYTSKAGQPTTNPAVGSESPKGEVTIKVTHTMQGVAERDINKLLAEVHEEEVPEGQVIIDNGLDKAKFEKLEAKAGNQRYLIKTTAFTGPDVDEEQLSEQLAGKGFSEAINAAKNIPGVNNARVDLSPFWVFSLPAQADNITIELKMNQVK